MRTTPFCARWLGDYIAEPEWKGQDVHFFAREEARGRLEDVHCVPCTKADLLGPALKESLEEIDQKLRKARPETANEQLLHRIVRKKFTDLTRDYDASDFHCYFFKYRQKTDPWKLVWCWGYQRSDVEPAQSLICPNKECEAALREASATKSPLPGVRHGRLARQKTTGAVVGEDFDIGATAAVALGRHHVLRAQSTEAGRHARRLGRPAGESREVQSRAQGVVLLERRRHRQSCATVAG